MPLDHRAGILASITRPYHRFEERNSYEESPTAVARRDPRRYSRDELGDLCSRWGIHARMAEGEGGRAFGDKWVEAVTHKNESGAIRMY